MSRYKLIYTLKRTRTQVESEPTSRPQTPDPELFAKSIVVTEVMDSEGMDHPDNAGKFFLNRILK